MKVCFITDVSKRDVFGLHFVNEFARRGNQVSVITFSGFDADGVDGSVQVYHRNIYGCSRLRQQVLFPLSVHLARKWLREIKPDVVVSLDAGKHAFVSVCSGFHPFVLFSYGSDVSYRAYLLNIGNVICRVVVWLADCVLAQDVIMAERLVEVGANPGDVVVQHWGVDAAFFKMNDVEKEFDVVNMHGYNTTYYRHIDVYLKALAILKKRGVRFRALLIGNEGFYDDIIRGLDIDDVLVQKPFVDKEMLRELLWKSKVLVDPVYPDPRYHDGFGYGIGTIQAMGCGVPIICADRRAAELRGDERWFYGLTFRHCDPGDLADKIVLLLGDERLREKVSVDNRLSVERCFDMRVNISCIEDEMRRRVCRQPCCFFSGGIL